MALTYMARVAQAVGLMKHAENKYNVGNLTKAQGVLIDAVADYAEKFAKDEGFPTIAEEIRTKVRISPIMEKYIAALEQPEKSSRDYLER